MLLNLFKRFNANPVYNFIIGILFFALFFLNSNLISFLYSQLSKQCICTHKMQFCLLGASPKPSESIRNLIEPLYPMGYFNPIAMHFLYRFIFLLNFSESLSFFLSIYPIFHLAPSYMSLA